jgi:WD40 repeat protein
VAGPARLMPLGGVATAAWDSVPGRSFSTAFSRDGGTLAFSSGRAIHVWDVARRSRLAVIPIHNGWVSTIALTPDGRTLAFGSRDKINLWDVTRRTPIATLIGARGDSQVLLSGDGRTLVSGSMDGTVRLWDVANGTEIGILAVHESPVFSLTFSPDGHTLASGSYDGAIRLSDTSVTSWRQRLCAIAGRSFTRAEWAEFLPEQTYQRPAGRCPDHHQMACAEALRGVVCPRRPATASNGIRS